MNQTNKKIINKVNREKNTGYNYNEVKNRRRIEAFTGLHIRTNFLRKVFDEPKNKAEEILQKVIEANTYEEGIEA